LVLAEVIAPSSAYWEWSSPALAQAVVQDVQAAATNYLRGKASELAQRGLNVHIVVLEGFNPAEAILEYAAQGQADLIAMSTHGRGGLAHADMGRVADGIVRHARSPLLLVNPNAYNCGVAKESYLKWIIPDEMYEIRQ